MNVEPNGIVNRKSTNIIGKTITLSNAWTVTEFSQHQMHYNDTSMCTQPEISLYVTNVTKSIRLKVT